MSLHLRSSMREPQLAQVRISSPAVVAHDLLLTDADASVSTLLSVICLEVAAIGETIAFAIPVMLPNRCWRHGVGGSPVNEIDHYKILEVDPEADPDVIEAAYRALSRKLHPDTDLTGLQRVRQTELDHSFAILSNAIQRRAYDARRADDYVPVGPGTGHISEAGGRFASGTLSERVQAGLNGESVGAVKLNFGRYAGWTLADLAGHDPDYLRWLCRHSSGIRYRSAILRLLLEREEARTPLHVQS